MLRARFVYIMLRARSVYIYIYIMLRARLVYVYIYIYYASCSFSLCFAHPPAHNPETQIDPLLDCGRFKAIKKESWHWSRENTVTLHHSLMITLALLVHSSHPTIAPPVGLAAALILP